MRACVWSELNCITPPFVINTFNRVRFDVQDIKIMYYKRSRDRLDEWNRKSSESEPIESPDSRAGNSRPLRRLFIAARIMHKRISLLAIRDDVSGGISSIRDDEIATEVPDRWADPGELAESTVSLNLSPSIYPPLGNSDTGTPTLHIESQKEDSWMLSEVCSIPSRRGIARVYSSMRLSAADIPTFCDKIIFHRPIIPQPAANREYKRAIFIFTDHRCSCKRRISICGI